MHSRKKKVICALSYPFVFHLPLPQVYDIRAYCVSVGARPVTAPPPLLVMWQGHMGVVVSVELAEDRDLVVTASTDCCVRVWTTRGRYIGETVGGEEYGVWKWEGVDHKGEVHR